MISLQTLALAAPQLGQGDSTIRRNAKISEQPEVRTDFQSLLEQLQKVTSADVARKRRLHFSSSINTDVDTF